MSTDEMLQDIISRLERIEQRQIKTTAMVEKVEEKEQEVPVVGSFGSAEIPQDK